ncbi:NUDIX hydrolase [Chitinimonas sp. PSY-7]|uniref:NUDIX domain-containing protein n=1 Tax=Chitinimonas sp. PSY-7 TaxID=3459088 RepID=UPI004040051B
MLPLPLDLNSAHSWLAQRLDAVKLAPTGDVVPSEEATPAAVLVPIVLHANGPTVLFTKRTEKLTKHAGQISFPGGRMELDETPEQAALRETEEEVGIAANLVTPVGRLAQYVTISRYRVTPVVGLLKPGFELVLQEDEVAEAFEVPLAFLLDRRNFTDKVFNLPERRAVTYALNWQGKIIWGATAGMLMTLYHTLLPESNLQKAD